MILTDLLHKCRTHRVQNLTNSHCRSHRRSPLRTLGANVSPDEGLTYKTAICCRCMQREQDCNFDAYRLFNFYWMCQQTIDKGSVCLQQTCIGTWLSALWKSKWMQAQCRDQTEALQPAVYTCTLALLTELPNLPSASEPRLQQSSFGNHGVQAEKFCSFIGLSK